MVSCLGILVGSFKARVWYDDNVVKHLTQDQREKVAEKLMELGNVAAGALLFGQALSGSPFNFTLAFLGLLLLFWFYAMAFILMKWR